MKIAFMNANDVNKKFMIKVPKGEKILTLQIQPIVNPDYELSSKFKPILYFKLVPNYGEV